MAIVFFFCAGEDLGKNGSGQECAVPSKTDGAMNQFDNTLGRLKEATKTSTDTELAKELGIGQQSISSAR